MDVTAERSRQTEAGWIEAMIRQPERWARLLTAAALGGALFGLIGPYNSFSANPTTRLFYWTMLFLVGTAILWPSMIVAVSAGQRRGLPPSFSSAAAIVISSAPLAALAAAGCYVFWPVHASGIRPLEWYGLTLAISLPGAAMALWLEARFLWAGRTLANAEMPKYLAASQVSGSYSALPAHLVEAVLCLQMEDHHVRIHTVGRSQLHLAPLRQVADELGHARGLQVHRSWWVARNAVRGWKQEGRAITLVLTNGQQVPVARNRIAELRESGLLNPAAIIPGQF
jgi:hypothetical protein